MEVVASLSQGRTAAAPCGLSTYKSVPLIFEPPCIWEHGVIGQTGIYFLPQFLQRIMQWMNRMSQSSKTFVSNSKENANKNNFPEGRRC